MERWMILFNINLMLILLFLLTYFLNKVSNNGIFFGIRFPLEYLKEEKLINIEKSYKKVVMIFFIVLFVITNLIIFNFNIYDNYRLNVFIGVFIIVVMIAVNAIYIPYYIKVKELKKENGWTYEKRNFVITDTTLRKPKKDDKLRPINNNWFLFLLIVPIVIIMITIYRYNFSPETINFMGISNIEFGKLSIKEIFVLFQFPIAQLFTITLMYIINKIIVNSRVDLNSGEIEKSIIRKKKFRRLGSMLMLFTSIEITIMFSTLQIAMLYNFNITMINNIFSIIIAITMFLFMIEFIKIGQGGRNINEETEKDELYKDDDDKWILGGLYFNKNDPAWMVEKRRGIGWTINFANPKGWLFIGGLIVFIIISIIIGNK
ncbi:MAG: DUF5808 domain-containing protein [Clostridium sp.]|nr:DUF5808 domain-containing protein [Clostridium sp.]